MEKDWLMATSADTDPQSEVNLGFRDDILYFVLREPCAWEMLDQIRAWFFVSELRLTECYLCNAHGQQLAALRYDGMTPNIMIEVWVDVAYRGKSSTDRI